VALVAWPPRFRILRPWIFSYGDLLKIECSYHLYLQMSLSSEIELLPQLQKWRQRCYVACGKILTTGGTSAALPTKVTSEVKLVVHILLHFMTLCISSVYIYIRFQSYKALFETPYIIFLIQNIHLNWTFRVFKGKYKRRLCRGWYGRVALNVFARVTAEA
jgi:hypothetical protein